MSSDAFDPEPTLPPPAAEDWAAKIEELLGEAEKAQAGPDRTELLCRISEISERRLGDPNGALVTLQTALADDPASGRVIQEMERIARGHGIWGELAAVTAEVAGAIGYFTLLAVVVLRGLPAPASRARIARALVSAVLTGLLAFGLIRLLGPLAIVPMPLVLLAVPAVAAGDRGVLGAIPAGAMLAVRHFGRTWGVWLLAMLFSTPIWISVAE